MVPNYWGINYQKEDDDDDGAPSFIGVDLKLEVEGKGFCETITTVGSAVAGKLLSSCSVTCGLDNLSF